MNKNVNKLNFKVFMGLIEDKLLCKYKNKDRIRFSRKYSSKTRDIKLRELNRNKIKSLFSWLI